MEQPVISLYDRDGTFVDWLRAPVSVKVTARWWEPGDATLTVQHGDYRASILRQPGARVRIEWRGEHLLGGPVTEWEHTGPDDPTWTFTIEDDAALLDRIPTLPNPEQPLTNQITGPCVKAGRLETVAQWFVAKNAPVVGVPVDIEADQGRGPNVTLSGRWQPISDVIGPSLRANHMSVRMEWQPETRRVLMRVSESRDYPIALSVESRTITRYSLSSRAPVATRVYLGRQDGATFTEAVNGPAEAEYGPHLRGATFASADDADEASTAATNTLNEGGAQSGLSVTLAEAGLVHYGGPDGLHVGDRVTLTIGDTQVTDLVREATLEWRTGQALTITPAIGGWDSHPAYTLADSIRRMAATVRRATRR